MKGKRKEYIWIKKKLLEIKLCIRNIIKIPKQFPLLANQAILKMDQGRTQKNDNAQGFTPERWYKQIIYVSRKERGIGLTSIVCWVDTSIQTFGEYSNKNTERLIKSHQRDKHPDSLPCNILRTILKMERVRAQTNETKDKEIDNYAPGFIAEWWMT